MNKQVVVSCLLALVLAAGCKESGKKNMVIRQAPAAAAEPDTTIYGICGKGTAMNTLELITDGGGKIIGCHVCGLHAADIVQEATALMATGCTSDRLHEITHIHPTIAELLIG